MSGLYDHRPWPVPTGPWSMAQRWHDLLFMHWPVPAEILRPLVPPELPVDTFDGSAWLGIVPFHMTGVRYRFTPGLPGVSAFPELNVRTYATLEGRPGLYFFSLDAASALAVAAARRFFHLPYFHARMSATPEGDGIRYRSHRIHRSAPAADLRMSYRPCGDVFHARYGTLEYFLVERYCLYTVYHGEVYRCEAHHPPWPLQHGEAEIECNTMADSHGIQLPDVPPLLHFARLVPAIFWPICRVGASVIRDS